LQTDSKFKKINKLVYPIAVLILLLLMLFTATYSWLSKTTKATAQTGDDYITIDADSGLEMNYGDEAMNQGTIDINKIVKEGFVFQECSSEYGRSIFFPLSKYSPDGDKDFANPNDEDFHDADTNKNNPLAVKTTDFLYRPATAKDKNTKYISIDLSLCAKDDVPVYLSQDTEMTGNIADAIRIAFIENEPNGKSVVFDNATQSLREKYSPIATISDDGKVSSCSPFPYCNTFSEYTYGRNVLFDLEAGVEKKITVNIWLEGTDADCTNAIASLNDLNIHIKFTTTSEDMNSFYFIDYTLEQWVDDDECVVFAIDENGIKQTMRKSDTYETDHTWIVDLAGSSKPVQFARYNPALQENKPQEWNLWDAGDSGSCTTYNAFAHNTGIWDDSFTGTTITFLDAMSDHPILEQSSGTEVLVCFTTEDGNGNSIDYTYKMSNQWNEKRWRVVIPSDVNDITFKWCESSDTTGEAPWLYYETTDRGTNTFFSANDYGGGYWSNKILLVDSTEGGWADVGDGTIWVAYFFDGNTEIGWTAMNGKTAGGRYIAGVPEGATKVIFCRYTEYAGYFDWDAVYNQTNDLTISTNNLYKVTGFDGSNRVTGTWYTTDDQ